MNIEILGVDPANRGAGLMFEAVRQAVSARYADVRYAMSLDLRPQDRLNLGAWGVLSRQKRKKDRLIRSVGERLPRSLISKFGVMAERDIDVILDASGFAYGDFWGPDKMAARIAEHVDRWKKAGKTVILLPQAWGPFTNRSFVPLLKKIFDRTDLIFARDETSWRHLRSVVGERRNLHLAPDFTNLLRPDLPSRLKQHEGRTLIVPNSKIIESHGEPMREKYVHFLVESANAARAAGEQPIFLIHEGARDYALAQAANARLAEQIPVVRDLSPLETKAVVAHAGILISSRFHGLVSGLSAGVPSLACGWSHKYQELMKDYGCPENVMDLVEETDLASRLGGFLKAARSAELKERITAAGEVQRRRSVAMWDEVFRVIGKPGAK